MEANGQTLYNDDLLNILPDGVIILDINREVILLNQQALTELHVHSVSYTHLDVYKRQDLSSSST